MDAMRYAVMAIEAGSNLATKIEMKLFGG
jgi:hypothetical protein